MDRHRLSDQKVDHITSEGERAGVGVFSAVVYGIGCAPVRKRYFFRWVRSRSGATEAERLSQEKEVSVGWWREGWSSSK